MRLRQPISVSLLLSGAASLLFLEASQAQLTPLSAGGPADTGTATLAPIIAPTGGYAANPQEYLTVNWSVSETLGGLYDYSYSIYNPTADVVLNLDGSLTSTPETVDAFQVSFNTSVANALVGSISGTGVNHAGNGVYWDLSGTPVDGGTTSATLTYQSAFAPTFGNAQGSDSIPPSPWTSISPGGQTVPVPAAGFVPEPNTLVLMGLAGLLTVPYWSNRKARSAK